MRIPSAKREPGAHYFCGSCNHNQKNPGDPSLADIAEPVKCCRCGDETTDGVYFTDGTPCTLGIPAGRLAAA